MQRSEIGDTLMGHPDYHDTTVAAWNPRRTTRETYYGTKPGGAIHASAVPVLPAPPAWMKDAECRHWQELFDQVYDYPAESRVQACKVVCDACPVIDQCREFAFEQDDQIYRYGVFGGLSARERADMVERRAYTPRAV